ncbi:MAG: site-2 protease family protein [Caldithrix sp.]|nr:site-2 protease family protein [Caldithrix sp.]
MYGSPLFKKPKSKIRIEEVRDIQDQLLREGIYSKVEEGTRNYYLKVVRGPNPDATIRYSTHIILFLLTMLTTTITGAMLKGNNPFASVEQLATGIHYSIALLLILLFHEMGHYLAARYYKIEATLPYFIPFFFPAFHPGTLGAFIKMKSSIPNRRALFDVGAAGPITGFIVAMAVLSWGFYNLPAKPGVIEYITNIHPLDDAHGINLTLGDSILFTLMKKAFAIEFLPMNEMYHFPYLFAGWFGLLVTAINLMPIGQLDGGHITYAMFGDKARLIAIGAFALLVILNVYLISSFKSFIWVLWILLILFYIRFRHPPTMDGSVRLDTKRKILGVLAYVIFVLSFIPLPVYIP